LLCLNTYSLDERHNPPVAGNNGRIHHDRHERQYRSHASCFKQRRKQANRYHPVKPFSTRRRQNQIKLPERADDSLKNVHTSLVGAPVSRAAID